jgi:hypothetical protein
MQTVHLDAVPFVSRYSFSSQSALAFPTPWPQSVISDGMAIVM